MKLNEIDSIVISVERGEYTFSPDDLIVLAMQKHYSTLYHRPYSLDETISYLTANCNQFSVNYSLDIQLALERYSDSVIKYENLIIVTYDSDSDTYTLEFQNEVDTDYIKVKAKDHPEASKNEHYWDEVENVLKVIEANS